MKLFIILLALASLVSCGKTTKATQKTTSYSLEALSQKGILFIADDGILRSKLSIVCLGTSFTNQEKMAELNNFRNSAGIENSSLNFTFGSSILTATEAREIFSQALSALQTGNPSSTTCPRQELASLN